MVENTKGGAVERGRNSGPSRHSARKAALVAGVMILTLSRLFGAGDFQPGLGAVTAPRFKTVVAMAEGERR